MCGILYVMKKILIVVGVVILLGGVAVWVYDRVKYGGQKTHVPYILTPTPEISTPPSTPEPQSM